MEEKKDAAQISSASSNPPASPQPTSQQTASTGSAPPSKSNKFNPLLVIIGIIVAVVLIVGAYFWFSSSKKNSQSAVTSKMYHIGILSGLDFFSPTIDGFKKKMAEQGYVEGKNVVYDIEKTNVEPAREESIVKKFIAEKVDLIFSFPTEVSLTAKKLTAGTNIPVVFADSYTEGVPLIDTVSHPGGNLTGVRFPGAEISVKRLEYVHQIKPLAKRIWVTYQSNYPPVPPMMEKFRAAAKTLDVTLVEVPATSAADTLKDLDARDKLAADPGIDVMMTVTEPLAVEPDVFNRIVKYASDHSLMLADSTVFPGDAGPLFSNMPNNVESGEQAATLADKIFKGINPGTIPVISPEIHLSVNAKVAQKLGITLTESFLSQAIQILH